MCHFYIAYKLTHLILLSVEVFYDGFSFHPFKIQLSQALQSYVIFHFYAPARQPEHVMRYLHWWI